MIRFEIKEDTIELAEYSEEATLTELVAELEAFRQTNDLRTRSCYGCGECCSDQIPVLGLDLLHMARRLGKSIHEAAADACLTMPEKLDIRERRNSIHELNQVNGLAPLDATLIYEYNNSEPLILPKKDNGECGLLRDNLCSQYETRPYICGLYLCNMGERLYYLEEMIIRQGTWHAYALLGWIPESDIAHNPFLRGESYEKLRLSEFDFDLKAALDKLFFYF